MYPGDTVIRVSDLSGSIIPNVTGTRYFGTNGDRVIFEDLASFTGNMPESGAPGHGHEIK